MEDSTRRGQNRDLPATIDGFRGAADHVRLAEEAGVNPAMKADISAQRSPRAASMTRKEPGASAAGGGPIKIEHEGRTWYGSPAVALRTGREASGFLFPRGSPEV